MTDLELTDAEARVLGCLIEKSFTTPDAYPLSLNSLRLACNQTTNRDPVVRYDDATVETALEGLRAKELARRLKNPGERAVKHRHIATGALEVADAELALLCVLLLRGAQTPGELKQRAHRMHQFARTDAIEATLAGLAERSMVERHERRPGQKEARWAHRLGAASAPPPLSAIEVCDVADGTVRSVAVDTEHEVVAKVARARRAAPSWSARSGDERALMLLEAAERLGSASVETDARSRGADVVAVIGDARRDFAVEMIVSALADGSTVLFKPATGATADGLAIVDALHEAGVPVDVVQCVIGGGAVGAALVTAGVDRVCFAGDHEAAIGAVRAARDRAIPVELSVEALRDS